MTPPLPTPYYQRGPVTMYHGDALEIGPRLILPGGRDARLRGRRVHCIGDPPYSARVHGEARQGLVDLPDGADRQIDLGFECLTPELRRGLAALYARHATGWVLVFGDCEPESIWDWRRTLGVYGLRYRKLCSWDKPDATPRTCGDGPADGWEAIHVAHAAAGGRTRWNGGGKRGVWKYPVVRDTEYEERVGTTPKPRALMIRLVEDFTDPGETVIDLTAGGFTTGIGAILASGGPRIFIGVELRAAACALGAERLDAELSNTNLRARAAGQLGLL